MPLIVYVVVRRNNTLLAVHETFAVPKFFISWKTEQHNLLFQSSDLCE